MKNFKIFLSFALFLISAIASAHTPIYLYSPFHQHNEAQMTLNQSDEILSIFLVVPAQNIVGFESLPQTSQQKGAIRKAYRHLQKSTLLSVAGCQLIENEINSTLLEGAPHDDAKNSLLDNILGNNETAVPKVDHIDFKLHYLYICNKPTTAIRFTGFDAFKNLRKVNLRAENGTLAKAIQVLTPSKSQIDITAYFN